MNLFKKRKYIPLTINCAAKDQNLSAENNAEPVIPDGLWIKCICCGKTIYSKEIGDKKICPLCGGCLRLNAKERIEITVDKNTFKEWDAELSSKNPMSYPGYEDKIKSLQKENGIKDAVLTGRCEIGGYQCALCVMDSNFIMGSMGSVVGEKITRVFERAYEEMLPVIIFTTSGGARMQEGIISLMQMAKVSAAVKKHSDKGLLYISVISDPTTGGVTASFAMLGDIILAEPGALIGFAGRRVIEQTIRQSLPEGFQTAEFLLEHGFIDKIVPRENIDSVLTKILMLHTKIGGM